MMIRFDDSLLAFANIIEAELGGDALANGVALRDLTGRLAFFAAQSLNADTIEKVSQLLKSQLGSYVREDRALVSCKDIGARHVLEAKNIFVVNAGEHKIRLLDRRLVGADWLLAPAEPSPPPPRFVFASLKGGVGRSTAIAVTASDLASRGQRVLAIDLDLEAPGLGAMLLDERTLPEFGTLDALVENGLSGLDDAFLSDLVGPSALAGGNGRVDVMPVFGRRSMDNPSDVLSKIARAYSEDVDADGNIFSFRSQVATLIQHFSDPTRYDAILIDARAGLHESTAASFLGLGADVLLFGLNEPQTFQGLKALFAHLALFVGNDGRTPEWLSQLTLVQGKSSLKSDQRETFADRCRDIAAGVGLIPRYSMRSLMASPAEPFNNVPWDDSIPDDLLFSDQDETIGTPVSVLDDLNYRGFDPFARRDLLSQKVYSAAFGSLLDLIRTSVARAIAPDQPLDPGVPDEI